MLDPNLDLDFNRIRILGKIRIRIRFQRIRPSLIFCVALRGALQFNFFMKFSSEKVRIPKKSVHAFAFQFNIWSSFQGQYLKYVGERLTILLLY